MPTHKDNVAGAIDRARNELDKALFELAGLPAYDPDVIGFATHAPKNYLAVADGTLNLLNTALKEHPDTDVRTWLQSLRQVTQLVHHAAAQLVSASAKAEPRLVFTPFDPGLGTSRACEYYGRVAAKKQIHVIFEALGEMPYIDTDRVAVAAVLDNLLSNAVKFSEPGKRVWVRVKAESSSIVWSIQDEGPGLTAEDCSKLFRHGVRLSAAPTGGESSTGFGLSVAKHLVDRLGGEIWCESEPGKGACFSFRLPLDPPSG